MSMMKVWGRASSLNTQKVLWCLAELELAYEREDIGLAFGGNREGWYLEMNPNGLVPTLEVDGLTLWESHAIVRYLAARCGIGTLWPQDPGARALADRWMDWTHTTIGPQLAPLFQNYLRPPEQRDNAANEARCKALNDAWPRLDRYLAATPYVGGDAFTMGDIPIGAWAHRWLNLPVERVPLPHVQAWYERLRQRPAYRQVVLDAPPMPLGAPMARPTKPG